MNETAILALNILAALLTLLAAGCLLRAWYVTRAAGLGWIALGLVWSMAIRFVILFAVDPIHTWTGLLVLPAFAFYALGSWRLSTALRSFYPPETAPKTRGKERSRDGNKA